MIGEPLDAPEAQRVGLVDEVIAADGLLERAFELAETLSSRASINSERTVTEIIAPPLPAMLPYTVETEALDRGAWGWMLFESGRIPQILLITAFVFVPYFATEIAGNAVKGQSLIAGVQTCTGLAVALTAPFLGSAVDRWGPRKPWLLICVALLAVLLASLWWAKADGSGLSIPTILAVLGGFTVLGGYSDVLFNSMMPFAVGKRRAARASGYALACANIVGVLALLAVLWGFELPGKMQLPGLPERPLFGLSAAAFEPARLTGPIAAGILLAFSIPLFLFAPDSPRTSMSIAGAVRCGTADLVVLVRQARLAHRNVAIFLLARMAFGDAIGAYGGFIGVFAAGVMGWRGPEMLIFGIFSAIFCGLGALVAQMLDRCIGPRVALTVELGGLAVFILGEIGTARDRIFFVSLRSVSDAPVWNGPVFKHAPDLIFLGLAFGAAATLVASHASARTLLVRLTPPSQAGAMFGLAALTGAATSWVAPLLIKIFTDTSHSQQAGFVPLLILLLAGFAAMFAVGGGGKVVEET